MQDQFHTQLSSGDVLDLEDIDQIIKWLQNITLRELIMNLMKKNHEQSKKICCGGKKMERTRL